MPDDEYPTLNVENNVYHYVPGQVGNEDRAIVRDIPGKIYFNGNIFPAGESDNYDTSTRHVIPAYAEVTMYDASTLGDTVVPFAGTHYPTQEEQDLLSEINIAIGGHASNQAHKVVLDEYSGGRQASAPTVNVLINISDDIAARYLGDDEWEEPHTGRRSARHGVGMDMDADWVETDEAEEIQRRD